MTTRPVKNMENSDCVKIELARSIMDNALLRIANLGLKATITLRAERKGRSSSITTIMPERVSYVFS